MSCLQFWCRWKFMNIFEDFIIKSACSIKFTLIKVFGQEKIVNAKLLIASCSFFLYQWIFVICWGLFYFLWRMFFWENFGFKSLRLRNSNKTFKELELRMSFDSLRFGFNYELLTNKNLTKIYFHHHIIIRGAPYKSKWLKY